MADRTQPTYVTNVLNTLSIYFIAFHNVITGGKLIILDTIMDLVGHSTFK